MNPFGIISFMVKYVTFTTSTLDVVRLRKDMRYRVAMRYRRVMRAVTNQLLEYDQLVNESQNDWSLLHKPMSLLRAIGQFHLVGIRPFIFFLVQAILTVYMLVKCAFHIILTGEDDKLANYYERNYYFPRLFSSHETPQIFYTHCLLLMMYCFTIRLLAIGRLIYYSIVNIHYYKQVSISHINSNFINYMSLSLKDWVVAIKYGCQHWRVCKLDYRHFKRHLSIRSRLIEKTAHINLGELIYTENLIDFYQCYKENLIDQLKNPTNAYWSGSPRAWKRYGIDPFYFSMCFFLLVGGLSLLLISITSYILGTVYFEIGGAIRERDPGAKFSLTQTLAYLPRYFEEPWRLIRFVDMLIFALLQLLCQADGAVYYCDVLILISRAYKVLNSLEQVRKLCIMGAGQYYQQLLSQYGSSLERYLERRFSVAISIPTVGSSKAHNLNGGAKRQFKYVGTPASSFGENLIIRGDEEIRGRGKNNEKRDTDDENEFDDDDDDDDNDTFDLRARYNTWRMGRSKMVSDYLSYSEEASLNRRLRNLVKLCHVLKREFLDTKSYHILYLNTMIIYSGFCLAYCASLMLGASSFDTFFILSISVIAAGTPLTMAIMLSIALDGVFENIYRNLNQMIVNERNYLRRDTLKQLMIESHSFESAKDRSIQIAGQFSITPGSLGPLVAYISTCILLLKRI